MRHMKPRCRGHVTTSDQPDRLVGNTRGCMSTVLSPPTRENPKLGQGEYYPVGISRPRFGTGAVCTAGPAGSTGNVRLALLLMVHEAVSRSVHSTKVPREATRFSWHHIPWCDVWLTGTVRFCQLVQSQGHNLRSPAKAPWVWPGQSRDAEPGPANDKISGTEIPAS